MSSLRLPSWASLIMGMFVTGALLLFPASSQAAVVRSGDVVRIPVGETINDDLYVAGGSVEVEGTVNGDLVAAGNNVTVNGTVTGDVMVAGGTVTLRGTMGDDVRAAGGQVHLRGGVADDFIAAGGMVEIESDGTVAGDAKLTGGTVTVSGRTGALDAATDRLVLGSGAVIEGNLNYWSGNEVVRTEGASVTGQIQRHEPPRADERREDDAWRTIVSLLGSALFAWLLLLAFPRAIERIRERFFSRFGVNFLSGFLFLVAIPILAIFLFLTVIGIPAGIVTLLAYPAVLYVAWLVMVLVVGQWLYMQLVRQDNLFFSWPAAVIGTLVVWVVAMVPVLGWLLVAAFFIAALGALIWSIRGHFGRGREREAASGQAGL